MTILNVCMSGKELSIRLTLHGLWERLSVCIYTYFRFYIRKAYKTALTKFRLSSHDLAIECGRYENTPRDERICKNCNLTMVENEYHFLFGLPEVQRFDAKIFKNVLLLMASTE